MSKIIDIAFGDYLCCELEKSEFSKDDQTIKFDVLFSVGEINKNIISYNDDFYNLIIKEGIYDIKKVYNLEDNLKIINNLINENYKIRIWTTHNQIDVYLMHLFICNYLNSINYDNVYVLFSDEYNKKYYSPSCMEVGELKELLNYEHKLTKEEINEYSKEWLKILKDNSDMRIISNNKVESVSFDYYDNYILNKLKKFNEMEKHKLVFEVVIPYHIYDTVADYLINRLIIDNKILVIKENNKIKLKFNNK